MAQLVDTKTRLTAEDLWALPDDGNQYELVGGELVKMPPPGARQSRLQPRLAGRLVAHVEAHNLGVVLTECGFVLARDPDRVRAPDVAFVSAARVAAGFLPDDGYPVGAPDLAVEIRSAHDSMNDLTAKAQEYLVAGARLVWLLDPYVPAATVLRADATTQTLDRAGTLAGADVVPGFALPLSDLFPEVA